jgi:predicted DsbA family dithiol-disulfide isomerase/uncharacterized membrane protein
MQQSLTLGGGTGRRAASLLVGLGMVTASLMTIRHFFAANYPESIYEGSFCDISAFFNCDSSAYSALSEVWGVPLGFFGLFVGMLVVLGALFPSVEFERSNKTIALVNGVGVLFLALASTVFLGSLCLICSGYWITSLLSLGLFWKYGIDGDQSGFAAKWFRASPKYLAVFAVLLVVGAYGAKQYHVAKQDAQSGGVAARIVEQYYNLPEVEWPSVISPYWTARATENFEDAPIRIVEYGDLLCSDCLILHEQLVRLREEFAGKMNVAFQFFPLEAACNDVVEKDKHPGACDLSYMAAYDPEKFLAIHDEVWDSFQAAKTPEWRAEMARRYGVEAALDDSTARAVVHAHIQTGAEYERTSERYAHGIRSTPTMIINNRMIIGTFPYEQLRAIFRALVDEAEGGDRRFMENWID